MGSSIGVTKGDTRSLEPNSQAPSLGFGSCQHPCLSTETYPTGLVSGSGCMLFKMITLWYFPQREEARAPNEDAV